VVGMHEIAVQTLGPRSRPSSSACGLCRLSVFQPICGILRPGSWA
jgi:hypothetical protein